MKVKKIKEYFKLSDTVRKVVCKIIDICIVICLLACYILCTYIYKSNPIIFYIGISILKSALMYIVVCVVFGFVFNKLIGELVQK